MIKVLMNTTNNLNKKILEEDKDIEYTNDYNEADFIISQSRVAQFEQFYPKTIYIAAEAPLAPHRHYCYSKFNEFHTVITYDPKGDNQFPFVLNGEAAFYPVRADVYPPKTREDTTIKTRGVFFAGIRGAYEEQPDAHGGNNITYVRTLLGEHFDENYPGSIIMGKGWKNQMTKEEPWRLKKQERIMDSNCDFVLALENTQFKDYITEKIWDGIMCDRVTLYLGAPNVEERIPTNCFVDLRPYFNHETKSIDFEALDKKLKEMTQEEYDEIIKNAREFRKKCEGRYRYNMDELTKFIIRRMKNEN